MLTRRASRLRELMEDQGCDPEKLSRTYGQLAPINRLFSRWRKTYRRHLRPLLVDPSHVYTVLDIGAGGGDIPLSLLGWAQADGFKMKITAIDPDDRALAFASRRESPDGLQFLQASARDMAEQGLSFDFLISNHLLHHLDEGAFRDMLDDADALASRLIVFSDIARSALAYLLFGLLTRPFFHGSFIVHDGLVSIRRSYTARELRARVPSGWEVHTLCPYRLLLIRRK
ncbi:MAG: methyltransferase domain-containing protein [Planctomycetota bacterium]